MLLRLLGATMSSPAESLAEVDAEAGLSTRAAAAARCCGYPPRHSTTAEDVPCCSPGQSVFQAAPSGQNPSWSGDEELIDGCGGAGGDAVHDLASDGGASDVAAGAGGSETPQERRIRLEAYLQCAQTLKYSELWCKRFERACNSKESHVTRVQSGQGESLGALRSRRRGRLRPTPMLTVRSGDAEDDWSLAPNPDMIIFKDPRCADEDEQAVAIIAFCHEGPSNQALDNFCGGRFLSNAFDVGGLGGMSFCVPRAPDDVKEFRNAEAAYRAVRFWTEAEHFREESAEKALLLQRRLAALCGDVQGYAGFDGPWQAMLAVLKGKFAQGSDLASALLLTEDTFLLACAPGPEEQDADGQKETYIWSDGGSGQGSNWLGLQLMLVRESLRLSSSRAGSSGGGESSSPPSLASSSSWTSFLNGLFDLETGNARNLAAALQWQDCVWSANRAVLTALDSYNLSNASAPSLYGSDQESKGTQTPTSARSVCSLVSRPLGSMGPSARSAARRGLSPSCGAQDSPKSYSSPWMSPLASLTACPGKAVVSLGQKTVVPSSDTDRSGPALEAVVRGCEFAVRVTKPPGASLGLDIQYGSTGLTVERVQIGPVHGWNIANPHRRVEPGDVIVEVNGRRGAAQILAEVIRQHETVMLQIVRGGQATLPEISEGSEPPGGNAAADNAQQATPVEAGVLQQQPAGEAGDDESSAVRPPLSWKEDAAVGGGMDAQTGDGHKRNVGANPLMLPVVQGARSSTAQGECEDNEAAGESVIGAKPTTCARTSSPAAD